MARFQRLACPSCGSALDVPIAHEQFFQCGSCGTTLEDTQYQSPTPNVSLSIADVLSQAGWSPATLPSYAARAGNVATRASKLVVAATLLAIFGGVAVGAYGIYNATQEGVRVSGDSGASAQAAAPAVDEANRFDIYNVALGALVPGEGTPTEAVLAVDGPDGERLVYVDLGAAEPVRWDVPLAELLPSDASIPPYERLVTSPDRVFLTFEDELFGFDRATGTLAFRVGMSDAVTNYCTNCVRVLGDTRLAALTADGTLQVWNATTGVSEWSTQLPGDVPRQLLDVGGNPAAITQSDDLRGVTTVFDAATGASGHTQAPACSDDFRSRAYPYDQVVELAGGSYVWAGECVQLWSPGADAPDWSSEIPSDPVLGRPKLELADALVTDAGLLVPTNVGVATVGLSDGAFALHPVTDFSQFQPIARAGDVAVVAGYRTRGTGRWELLGVNVADPARSAWRLQLAGEDGSDGFITSEEWLIRAGPGGIAVVEIDVDAGTLRTQTVDPASGTAGAPATLAIEDLMFADLLGWRDGVLVLAADQRVLAIDTATGTIVNQAP